MENILNPDNKLNREKQKQAKIIDLQKRQSAEDASEQAQQAALALKEKKKKIKFKI